MPSTSVPQVQDFNGLGSLSLLGLFLIITASFLIVLIFSFLETPPAAGYHLFLRKLGDDLYGSEELGLFGKMMIEMLPDDLVFTAFVPSDKAFSRDLGLKSNISRPFGSLEDYGDNTYAVVSRILSFAVVPYKVEERDIGNDETASYESLGGFTLKIWKRRNGGGLVVNGIETEKMGLGRGKIMVHTMDGVIMDYDFAVRCFFYCPRRRWGHREEERSYILV